MELDKNKLCIWLNKRRLLLKLIRTLRIIIWSKPKEPLRDKEPTLTRLTFTPHSSSVKLQMPLRITEMIYSSRSHLIVRMMPSISEQFIWDPQSLNHQELFLILAQSIWLSPPFFAMMRPPETTNSRSTTLFKVDLSKEISNTRDARLCHMICTSLTLTKSCQRPLLS